MNTKNISNIESEAGVVASAIVNPSFTYFSEQLKPSHFTDPVNACLYFAVSGLARKGIGTINAFNIIEFFNSEGANGVPAHLTQGVIEETLVFAPEIAAHSVEEYKMYVANVLDAAHRRTMFEKLQECERFCYELDWDELKREVYNAINSTAMEFSSINDVPLISEVSKQLWEEIVAGQDGGMTGIPFNYPTLNKYATIDRGELFIFAAEAKQGKSIMLMNCAVDLLRRDKSVLYVDSEHNTRTFYLRMLSYLTGIEFRKLVSGSLNDWEETRIERCSTWLSTKTIAHMYMPTFDAKDIYSAAKRFKHTHGLDVLIVDYFKDNGDGDAFDSYQELGRFVDIVKNRICGEMDIAGIGAVQATANGRVADSAKIGRNASTVALIQDKTQEEMDADGILCGNKKLRVILNRNGAQMSPDEYIDLQFDGNVMSIDEAQQHTTHNPF